MIVKGLENLDHATARAVVANSLAALLAMGGYAGAAEFEQMAHHEKKFIQELAAKANVSLEKIDHRGRTKLLDLAGDTLIALSVGSAKPAEADAKLGSLGVLALTRYTLHDTDTLINSRRRLGLRPRDVHHAVHQADAYQHLFPPDDFGGDREEMVSVFVRLLNKSAVTLNAEPADWLVVVGRRQGKKIDLYDVFRVFEDDLELNPARAKPVDLLEAFANRHGLDMVLGDTPVGKFCLYQTFPGNLRLKAHHRGANLTSFLFRYDVEQLSFNTPPYDKLLISFQNLSSCSTDGQDRAGNRMGRCLWSCSVP